MTYDEGRLRSKRYVRTAAVAGAGLAAASATLAWGGCGSRGEPAAAGSIDEDSGVLDAAADASESATDAEVCEGPPGMLDPTFGDGGVVVIPVQARGTSVLALGDGSIVVGVAPARAFSVAGLVRLRRDGTLDTSFGDGGIVDLPARATGAPPLAGQPDGKLLVVGSDTETGSAIEVWAVMRRLNDGRPDPSFNSYTGEVQVHPASALTPAGPAASIVVQPDGRLLVSGTLTWFRAGKYAAARLESDAGLDDAFGQQGRSSVGVRETADTPGVLALAPDGAIVIAGGSARSDARSPAEYDLSAVRLTPNGELDVSFADGGKLLLETNGASRAFAAAPDANGNVLLAGYLGDDAAVFRVTPKGELDPTFGDAGVVTFDVAGGVDVATAVLVQADGKIVVAGSTLAGAIQRAMLARVLPNGAPDSAFGAGGMTSAMLAGRSSVVEGAALDRCHVVTVGYRTAGAEVVVARWRR